MIRAITYDKQLFKSNDFALMSKRFFNNQDGKVEGCTLGTSGNTITISTGWFVASGYYTNISSQEVINSSNGTLVYEIDLTKINTTQEFNQGTFKIISGEPIQEDLFNGGTLYQMPIATILTDGTNATIEEIWEEVTKDFQTQINGKLDSSKILTLTGTIDLSNGSGSKTISLPTGFTKDNTIVISVGVAYQMTTIIDFNINSSAYFNARLTPDDTIILNVAPNGGSGPSGDRNYKLTIMRVD